MNTDNSVKKENLYISVSVLIFIFITQGFFLAVRKWNYTVLLGNFLGGIAAILNFYLMGRALQNAVNMNEKSAKYKLGLSHFLRTIMLFLIAATGAVLPCFNTFSVLLALFFPRIAIALRPLFKK